MGQSLKKLAPGSDEKKAKEIGPTIEKCYHKYFLTKEEWNSADFYHAVCQTVEEINKILGSTQFCVPNKATLEKAYNKHHPRTGDSLSKEEFRGILQDVIIETGFTGLGAKDLLLYIFGVPVVTLFIKNGLIPKALPNDFFIPFVTSATVFLLAKLNKI